MQNHFGFCRLLLLLLLPMQWIAPTLLPVLARPLELDTANLLVPDQLLIQPFSGFQRGLMLNHLRKRRPSSTFVWNRLGESGSMPPNNVTKMREVLSQIDRDLLEKLLVQMHKQPPSGDPALNTSGPLQGLQVLSQRLQSVHPMCTSGGSLDAVSSDLPHPLQLHFRPQFIRSQSSESEYVIAKANLHLYKLAFSNASPDETITFSLYAIGHKDSRHLIERKTLDADFEGWFEFNVQRIVALWQTNPLKNHGFQIEVTDVSGQSLNPSNWIHPMNCSDTRVALPNLLALQPQLAKQLNLSGVSLNERRHYPTLDVVSVLLRDQQANLFRRRVKNRSAWQEDLMAAVDDQNDSSSVAGLTINRRPVKRHLTEQLIRAQMIRQLLQNISPEQVFDPIIEQQDGQCQLVSVRMQMPPMFFDQEVLYPRQLRITFCTNQDGENVRCISKQKKDLHLVVVNDKDEQLKFSIPSFLADSCTPE